MSRTTYLTAALLALALLGVSISTVTAAQPVDPAALDKAFEALKTYDWGKDRSALQALDDAVFEVEMDHVFGHG